MTVRFRFFNTNLMWTFASLIELCDVIDGSPTVGVLVSTKLFGQENYVACR